MAIATNSSHSTRVRQIVHIICLSEEAISIKDDAFALIILPRPAIGHKYIKRYGPFHYSLITFSIQSDHTQCCLFDFAFSPSWLSLLSPPALASTWIRPAPTSGSAMNSTFCKLAMSI